MRRHIILSVLVGLTLLGCAADGQRSGDPDVPRHPAWVLNPDKPGHIGVVGSAPKQDWGGREAQQRVALMKARQELAQMLRVQVQSTTQVRIEDRAGQVTRDADVDTQLRSTVSLRLDQAQVIEEWTDPRSGELYLWVVIPK